MFSCFSSTNNIENNDKNIKKPTENELINQLDESEINLVQ